MRPAFFLKEAIRSLSRNAAPSLAATITVLLTALVLGIFIPIVQATTGSANEVRNRVLVDVFIENKATDAEVEELRTEIASIENVKSVAFVSKEQALKEEQKERGELYELLGRNPLPDSFRISPDDPDEVEAIADQLAPADPRGRRQPQLAAIDEVKYREDDTDKILSVTNLVKWLGGGMALLLVFASIALVANTIRLSIFARRREVEVMKLVGATNWFIRWPFVIEGVMVGAMGGVLAILMLWIAKETVVDPLSDKFALIAAPDTIDFPLLIALLLMSCIAVSAAGSGLTLRRFLRI
jgi:cell division transport system permease protein